MKIIFYSIIVVLLSIFVVACGDGNGSGIVESPEVVAPQIDQTREIANAVEEYLEPLILGLRNVFVSEISSGYTVSVNLQPPATVVSHRSVSVLSTIFIADYFEQNDLEFASLDVRLFNDEGEPLLNWKTTDFVKGTMINFVQDDLAIIDNIEDLLTFESDIRVLTDLGITSDAHALIDMGMSRDEVINIIGIPPVSETVSEFMGTTSTIMVWMDLSFRSISIILTDGRVTTISQMGLHN